MNKWCLINPRKSPESNMVYTLTLNGEVVLAETGYMNAQIFILNFSGTQDSDTIRDGKFSNMVVTVGSLDPKLKVLAFSYKTLGHATPDEFINLEKMFRRLPQTKQRSFASDLDILPPYNPDTVVATFNVEEMWEDVDLLFAFDAYRTKSY